MAELDLAGAAHHRREIRCAAGQPGGVPRHRRQGDHRRLLRGSRHTSSLGAQPSRHPRTQIEIGSETVDVEARELPGGERDAVWARIAEIAPPFAKYQTQTDRTIPLFELKRT
jgi:hypothetical protein